MMTTVPLVVLTAAFSIVMDVPDHFICGALTRQWMHKKCLKARIGGIVQPVLFDR